MSVVAILSYVIFCWNLIYDTKTKKQQIWEKTPKYSVFLKVNGKENDNNTTTVPLQSSVFQDDGSNVDEYKPKSEQMKCEWKTKS